MSSSDQTIHITHAYMIMNAVDKITHGASCIKVVSFSSGSVIFVKQNPSWHTKYHECP